MKDGMPSSRLVKRSDITSLGIVLAHVALVFAPVFLSATIGPSWWLLLFWIWFGFGMNGLLNLMHEAAHYHVFRSRAANDVLGRWILGPLSLADFDAYRQRHWDHHRHLGEPNDPKVTYHMDVRGHRMFELILRCLALVEAKCKFHQTRAGDDEPAPGRSFEWLLRVAIVQSLIGGALLLLACSRHPHDLRAVTTNVAGAYGFVYVYGLASLTVLAANLRAIAEHQIGSSDAAHSGAAALRNFSCGPVARLIFGAYGFGEHATHHHQPAIPYYRLPAATIELTAKDPRMAPVHGYLGTILSLVQEAAPSPMSSGKPRLG